MINGVSDSSTFLNSINTFQTTQSQIQNLTNQLNTQKKSQDLVGYGQDASKILDLSTHISSLQSYISTSTHIDGYLTAYDTTLKQLRADAAQLHDAVNGLKPNDPTSTNSFQSLIKGLEVDVTATLNQQYGDRFLFAGTRFTTQPVIDLTQASLLPATPTPFVAVTPVTPPPSPLPNYDTQGQGTPAGTDPFNQAYATQTANISDTTQITYGITSTDPSFQRLIYALKQAEAASTAVEPQRSQFLANANTEIGNALQGIDALSQQNNQTRVTIKTTQTTQKQAINSLTLNQTNLQQIDSATVATQISTLQNQLQASFKVTSTILNLSLLNFIK